MRSKLKIGRMIIVRELPFKARCFERSTKPRTDEEMAVAFFICFMASTAAIIASLLWRSLCQ